MTIIGKVARALLTTASAGAAVVYLLGYIVAGAPALSAELAVVLLLLSIQAELVAGNPKGS